MKGAAMQGLAGKRALITGAGNGIGRAIAFELARQGAALALVDIDGPAAEATAAQLRSTGCAVAVAVADVSDAAAVRAAVSAFEARGEPLDILVNNAGIARLGSLLSISDQDWRDTFAVNVDGMFHATRAVVPGMVARRRGAVVNLASWLGRRGNALFGAYAASKFAVIGLTQSLAAEVAPCGVRVNAVCPGIIADTPMRLALEQAGAAAGLPPTEERVKAIPLGRAGTPDDVAKVVVFLASEAAAYVTGAAYDVSGGHWMT
jgi:NAD(P)-dependent dehydrogenase (short-subunit alcohol dehydrogenase family)